MRRPATSLLVGVFACWQALATVTPSARTDDGFSPLFERRLQVGLENMDKSPERIFMARQEIMERPVATPFSGNPLSVCIGSACLASICIGSACLSSRCLGSTCIVSGCGGSACVASGCGGSACIGSTCGGSACVGSVCVGSACLECRYEEIS